MSTLITEEKLSEPKKMDVSGSASADGEAADEEEPQSWLLNVAEKRFFLTLDDDVVAPAEKEKLRGEILEVIKDKNMSPWYKSLCEHGVWDLDREFNERMEENIKAELKDAEEAIKDAEENRGETEVRDEMLKKAEYFQSIGDKERARTAFEETFKKSVGNNSKLEIVFLLLQLGFFFSDFKLIKEEIARAKRLVEAGGDWEKRNQLKVYEATYLMIIRDTKGAAELLIDAIATFSCYELFSFKTFISYTVLTSMVSLDRVTLGEKVVEAPEILSVIEEIPFLNQFLNSLYKCNYHEFFPALQGIMATIGKDRYLHRHASYFLREIRVVVYSQFLESYLSVTLQSMADSFGVGMDFIDSDLSRFISTGRLNCKIDKVRGIIETKVVDAKNAQYQKVVKEGDLLLNRIQKLSRVITY